MLMLIALPSSAPLVIDHDFNTSHVNVNQNENVILKTEIQNFNTSHVNVNRPCRYIYIFIRQISIHLMLMLISFLPSRLSTTSFISIHLMLMLITISISIHSTQFYFNTSHVNVNLYY